MGNIRPQYPDKQQLGDSLVPCNPDLTGHEHSRKTHGVFLLRKNPFLVGEHVFGIALKDRLTWPGLLVMFYGTKKVAL